jgi:uncharacterized protein
VQKGAISLTISRPGFAPLRPYVLVGMPEVGLVGTIAASYIASRLSLPEVGYIDSELFPPILVVHDGEPHVPLRLFGNEKLIVVNSEVPPPPDLYAPIADALVEWSSRLGSPLVIGMTGIPSRERLEIERPKVFVLSNSLEVRQALKERGTEIFQEGLLVGFYAQLMKSCLRIGQPNLTVMAESHLQFPDPGAAASIVAQLSSYLSLNLDITPLLEESEHIRLRTRELMNRTLENMSKVASGLYG